MKKSTKISLIALGIGVAMLVIGLCMSGNEIKNKVLKNGFSINVGKSLVNLGGKKQFVKLNFDGKLIDKKYSSNLEKVSIDVSDMDISFAKSSDKYIHVAYGSNYKKSLEIKESGNVLTIRSKEDYVDYDDDDWDDWDDDDEDYDYDEEDVGVSIGFDGINVNADDANVSIDSDGINVDADDANVNIDSNGVNVNADDTEVNVDNSGVKVNGNSVKENVSFGEMIIYIPNNYKGKIECDMKDGDILASNIIFYDMDMNCDDGDILLDKVDVKKNIDISTKDGDINGSFKKTIRDYDIWAFATGDTNLPFESPSSGAKLRIYCNKGDAYIDFADL